MKYLFLIFILNLGLSAKAEYLLSYGRETRYESDSAQSAFDRELTVLNFALRYSQDVSYAFEYGQSKVITGNRTLSLLSTYEEFTAWCFLNPSDYGKLDPYVGFGLGNYRETVKINLLDQDESEDNGSFEFMSGLAVGARFHFVQNVFVAAEGRYLYGRDFDPNPESSLLFRLGLRF